MLRLCCCTAFHLFACAMCGKQRSEVDEHRSWLLLYDVPYYRLLVDDYQCIAYTKPCCTWCMYWHYWLLTIDLLRLVVMETWEFKLGNFDRTFSCPDDTLGQENRGWNYLVMRPWNFVRSFVVRTLPKHQGHAEIHLNPILRHFWGFY